MTTPDWLKQPVSQPCEQSRIQAEQHQRQLTKPPGAMGELETIAIQLASLQATATPTVDNIHIAIFAADHGIATEGVSAYPQAVTGEMIRNFATGGAAISVLARQLNAQLTVTNLGTINALEPIAGVNDRTIAPGTESFSKQAAMTEAQLAQALATGMQEAEQANQSGSHLFIGGEMGIGNTTSATALSAALLNRPAAELVGPGTGISTEAQLAKQQLIDAALQLHGLEKTPIDALQVLQKVGGFEIAALCGAFIRCAQLGIPVLVDGFIATAAALAAINIQSGVRDWLLLGHQSAEPGHHLMIEALQKTPLLALNLRLGEASGAACAAPLLRLACALHNQMATFDSAGISNKG